MDDNAKHITHSTIERSNIGTVINGDVDMQYPVFNLGNPPQEEESREDLIETREALQNLLRRARFKNALVSGVLSFCLLVVMAYLAHHFPPTGGMTDLAAMVLVFATIPAGLWMTCPPEWREHVKNSKRRIKIITARIDHIEDKIALLEIIELSARRTSRP